MYEIIDGVCYVVVQNEQEAIKWLQTSECTRVCDSHIIEIIFKEETH